MGRRKKDLDIIKLFWSKVNILGENDCWEWNGKTRLPAGYGRMHFNGKDDTSNRIAWIITNGEIPKGMFVCHHCDNPSCCNPKHLFLGTFSDNMQDMWNKQRHPFPSGRPSETMVGENNVNSVLIIKNVKDIREQYKNGVEISEIQRKFLMVQKPAIWKIVHNLTWKNLA